MSNLSYEKTDSKQSIEIVVSRELAEWALFSGGGHMSELVASFDWSNTLGGVITLASELAHCRKYLPRISFPDRHVLGSRVRRTL